MLWFAFILVTLSHWKQRHHVLTAPVSVVICFHFSNFEPLETASTIIVYDRTMLWFAFILVTLSHWKQRHLMTARSVRVVICFHFSNFEPLETAPVKYSLCKRTLWFAFILVTLSHWKQRNKSGFHLSVVVICFHFSNFEPLETAVGRK